MKSREVAMFIGILIGSMFLLITATTVYAAPIENIPVTVTHPDGTTLNIFSSGDEYFNWLHDENGYTIIQNPETGYYVYADLINDELIPTDFIVGKVDPLSTGLPPYLNISAERRAAIRNEFLELSAQGTGEVKNAPRAGTITNLVIFIRFSDESEFTTITNVYDNMLNSTTPGENSLRNYYQEVSYNSLTVTSLLLPTPPGSTIISYQDGHPRGYYQPYNAVTNTVGYQGGDNGSERRVREHTLIRDAINHISGLGQFPAGATIDSDGDGVVDSITFVVSGSPTGWSSLLWPHQWTLSTYAVAINEKIVNEYTFHLETQINTGVLAHEMFHLLGAPDLYHYTGNGIQPVGPWDVMEVDLDPPQHMGCYMKFKYGDWISNLTEITAEGRYTLNPSTSPTNNCFKIASPNSSEEYFVVEYRRDIGTFESSIPGSGLIIYRINSVATGNASGPPDEVYIYRPGGTLSVNGNINNANFSTNSGRTRINDNTDPSSFLANGDAGGLRICNVSAADATISFDYGSSCSSTTNDDFGNHLSISNLPFTNSQSTTEATTVLDDPIISCLGGQKYNTVWYSFTPSANQSISIDTFGSNYDTVLAVWKGTRGNLVNVACNDDALGVQSRVKFNVTTGITYYIEVASYSLSGGSLILNATIANDDFNSPEVISNTPYAHTQDTSMASIAGDDPIFTCGSRDTGSDTVWYTFTPSVNGTFTANTVNSNYDTMLSLWTGQRGNLSSVVCNDDYIGTQSQISVAVQGGTTYFLEVAGYGAETSALVVKTNQGGDRAPSSDTVSVASRNLNLYTDFSTTSSCPGGPNTGLFTTQDNRNNTGSGGADCDMDTYLYNNSSIAPIEFTINVPNVSSITSADLLLLNWDVDETSGEVDEVYLNGHYAGTLTGASNVWSTTSLSINPAWVVSGNNLVQVYIDVNNTAYWAVKIDWGQLVLSGQNGTASIRSVNLDKSTYSPGNTVSVNVEVDTSLTSQDVRTEINLRNATGTILAGTSVNHTLTGNGNDPVSANLVIPTTAAPGTYNIQVLVYDQLSNLLQNSKITPFTVRVTTLRTILYSTGSQDGWVLESSETSESGGTMDSTSTVLIVGDDASDRQYRSMLSFDTSSLPDTAVITQAVLSLRVNEVLGGGNPIKVFNYFMADTRTGSFGASSALAAQDFGFSPTVAVGPLGALNRGGWYYVDLKTGKSAVNTTGLTQVRLRFSIGDNDNGIANIIKIYSGNSTVKPQLSLWYYVP